MPMCPAAQRGYQVEFDSGQLGYFFDGGAVSAIVVMVVSFHGGVVLTSSVAVMRVECANTMDNSGLFRKILRPQIPPPHPPRFVIFL